LNSIVERNSSIVILVLRLMNVYLFLMPLIAKSKGTLVKSKTTSNELRI